MEESVQGEAMLLKRVAFLSFIFLLASIATGSVRCNAQAALLMEEPYGFYGAINPTGHNAIYLEKVCAESPIRLRRCRPGEMGVVISRYEGVNHYDWIAIPLIPYLYSVENAGEIPAHVNHDQVVELRRAYRDAHFLELGLQKSGGSYVPDGWAQLIGASYERTIFAFRFETTPAQDDALIALLNSSPNRSHFRMLFRNCADFARVILNIYFPHKFHRSIFPDAGITTPKQITWKLVHYARKHPALHLTVFEIPQIPGYRARSRSNKDIAESFATTAYAVPLTIWNPYLFGGIFVDYLFRGRYRLVPKDCEVIHPDDLAALTAPPPTPAEASAETGTPAAVLAPGGAAETQTAMEGAPGPGESKPMQ